MAFTFNPNLSTPRDQVRDRIGDTVEADPLFPDETLDAYLAQHETVLAASIVAVDRLVRRFARLVDSRGSAYRADLSQRYRQYQDLLVALRAEALTNGLAAPVAYAGGVDRTDKMTRDADMSLVRPAFTRDNVDRAARSERLLS